MNEAVKTKMLRMAADLLIPVGEREGMITSILTGLEDLQTIRNHIEELRLANVGMMDYIKEHIENQTIAPLETDNQTVETAHQLDALEEFNAPMETEEAIAPLDGVDGEV